MFKSGMQETIENKMEIIDFSIETVELAFQIIYNRKIPTLTLNEKLDVLKFLDKYAILDLKVSSPILKGDLIIMPLKGSMETSLVENISFETVVQITNASLFTNSVNLKKRCNDFLLACFNMDRKVDDFDLLDKDFAFQLLKTTCINA